MKRRGTYRVRRVFFFLVNRVEHQKRTQTATKWWPFGFVFGVQLGLRHTQALINIQRLIIIWCFFTRAEKTLKKTSPQKQILQSIFTKDFLSNKEYLLRTFFRYRKETPNDDEVLDINQCLCLPKAELNTKNEPKRPPLCGRLGSFLVFNSVHQKKKRGVPGTCRAASYVKSKNSQ